MTVWGVFVTEHVGEDNVSVERMHDLYHTERAALAGMKGYMDELPWLRPMRVAKLAVSEGVELANAQEEADQHTG